MAASVYPVPPETAKSCRITTMTRPAARKIQRLSGAEQRQVREAIPHPLPLQHIEPWQTRPGLYRARGGELRLMLRLEHDDMLCLLV